MYTTAWTGGLVDGRYDGNNLPSLRSWPLRFATCSDGAVNATVDFLMLYNLDKVTIWNWHFDGRSYCSQKLQLSTDGSAWTTLFDTGTSYGPVETSSGNSYTFALQPVRYIRYYIGRANYDKEPKLLEIQAYDTTGMCLPLFDILKLGLL
eukprot:gene29080-36154_t